MSLDAINSDIDAQVERLAAALQQRGAWLATAESCTGGGIAEALTAKAGSSAWFDRALVTYSNRAKQELLGVPEAVLAAHGAVSEATALAMAAGALQRSGVDYSVAVTGIAGPDGGSADKPVGTVWIGWADSRGVAARCFLFAGDRHAVRRQTIQAALAGLLDRLR